MAIRNIIKDGDPFLRAKSREVKTIDRRILSLLDDLKDTLQKAGGVGLAAVQVGVLKCVAVVADGDQIMELINPQIILREGEQENLEGCLSCPNRWGLTHRPAKVGVRCQNRDGQTVTYTGEDLIARAFCHEIDHMSGILFYDHAVKMFRDEEELDAYLESQE